MATAPRIPYPAKTPLPFPPRRHSPLVLWHLLSLDAPTVAALWTLFLARANHLRLPATSIAAMAIAVWLLYAADRLLDARLLDARPLDTPNSAAHPLPAEPLNGQTLEARHRFHHGHRRAFRLAIAAASITLAALLPRIDPSAIRLYLIEGSFLIGYFVLIHATRSAHRLPKEFAVGLFFAAATFIPTVARQPELRLPLIAPALLFAVLCSLNCLFIYAWEHASPTHLEAHPTTRFALKHLRTLALAQLVASVLLTIIHHHAPWPVPAAIALSTAALLLLHRSRHRLHPTILRAAADLALLTPLFFLLR